MKSRILIVDDEFDLAELLSDMLTDRGYDVTVAINGVSGMSLLMSNDFELVITDVMMPVMDGIEMVKTLREEQRLSRLPVIVMSAQVEHAEAEIDGMVQAFLQKPFRPQVLYATVDRLLDTN